MSEPSGEGSYRTRNIVLAAIAVVVLVAAVVRMAMTAAPQAPEAAVPSTAVAVAPASTAEAPQLPVAGVGHGAIDVAVTYRGASDALPPTAKVYVFIRPVGERMPLAVQTYALGDLPVTVEFSNPSDSAAGAGVEVVARLSLTGAVALQPGDSEVVSDPITFDTTRRELSLTLPGPAAG